MTEAAPGHVGPLPAILRAAFAGSAPERLGVAVSGGGDSMALLHLLADWARDGGPGIAAVTVDHGLRPGAAVEAAAVSRTCAGLGVPHEILRWHWDGAGNLQDRARRARLSLIADWARGQGIGMVALGHTADDQAETFLMRLGRGSGLDGLSGMAARRGAEGITWVRPLLSARRAALRDFLRDTGAEWFEDPSNEDTEFARVRARRALAELRSLDIGAEGIAETAARLRQARDALAEYARRAARVLVRIEAGDVLVDPEGFADLPEETRFRLVSHALVWVASAEYPPRRAAMEAAWAEVTGGRPVTLHGCLLLPAARGRGIRICREYGAVRGLAVPIAAAAGTTWDARWRLVAPAGKDVTGLTIRALGDEGLRVAPGWRRAGRPRAALLAAPAVWRGDVLVAAPQAGRPAGWRAELACGDEDFFRRLIVH